MEKTQKIVKEPKDGEKEKEMRPSATKIQFTFKTGPWALYFHEYLIDKLKHATGRMRNFSFSTTVNTDIITLEFNKSFQNVSSALKFLYKKCGVEHKFIEETCEEYEMIISSKDDINKGNKKLYLDPLIIPNDSNLHSLDLKPMLAVVLNPPDKCEVSEGKSSLKSSSSVSKAPASPSSSAPDKVTLESAPSTAFSSAFPQKLSFPLVLHGEHCPCKSSLQVLKKSSFSRDEAPDCIKAYKLSSNLSIGSGAADVFPLGWGPCPALSKEISCELESDNWLGNFVGSCVTDESTFDSINSVGFTPVIRRTSPSWISKSLSSALQPGDGGNNKDQEGVMVMIPAPPPPPSYPLASRELIVHENALQANEAREALTHNQEMARQMQTIDDEEYISHIQKTKKIKLDSPDSDDEIYTDDD
eukprot:Seg1956.7 transcript_id=Seg1956.7/GoldUCD/mRNA.D3Y31 product="hypothetical protein" protein_id=Seg1956.7/GoldUCD/D3Y31